jgi:hypothetical protein
MAPRNAGFAASAGNQQQDAGSGGTNMLHLKDVFSSTRARSSEINSAITAAGSEINSGFGHNPTPTLLRHPPRFNPDWAGCAFIAQLIRIVNMKLRIRFRKHALLGPGAGSAAANAASGWPEAAAAGCR